MAQSAELITRRRVVRFHSKQPNIAGYSEAREDVANVILMGSTPITRSNSASPRECGPAPSKRTDGGSSPLEATNLSRPAEGTLPPTQNIESSNLSRDPILGQ